MLDDRPTYKPTPPRRGRDVLRVVWMAVIALVWLIIVHKAYQKTWTIDGYDAAILASVAVGIAARAIDVKYFNGTTMGGSPGTQRDVVRYAVWFVLVTGVAWPCAQSVTL